MPGSVVPGSVVPGKVVPGRVEPGSVEPVFNCDFSFEFDDRHWAG